MERSASPTKEVNPMLEFLRALRRDRNFLVRLPSLSLAFFLAEAFYKFHSFSLECLAFLATWAIIDFVADYFMPSKHRRAVALRAHAEGADHASPQARR